jgi:hypothetical protein
MILVQSFDEEQQRPPPVRPCQPELHEEIKYLCNEIAPMLSFSKLTQVFRPLSEAFTGTTLENVCQFDSWGNNHFDFNRRRVFESFFTSSTLALALS